MSIRKIIEGLEGKKNEEQAGDFDTIGSGLSKEDADKLARDKQGTVVKDDDDESGEEKFSVIKKYEERV